MSSSSNQAKPRVPEVCVGVPCAVGYPIAPPRRSIINRSSRDHDHATARRLLILASSLVALGLVVLLGLYVTNSDNPAFTVESISVSLSDNSTDMTTTWTIGFSGSVINTNLLASLDYTEINATVLATTAKYPTIIPVFRQGPINTTSLSMTFNDTRPHYNTTTTTSSYESPMMLFIHHQSVTVSIEFGARFRYVLNGFSGALNALAYDDPVTASVCKDMKVGFLPNTTLGTLFGGSMLCDFKSLDDKLVYINFMQSY